MNTCSVKSVGAWRLVRSPGSFPFPFLFMLLLVFYPNTVIKRMDFDEFANFCTLRQKKCTESQSKQWYKQIRKKNRNKYSLHQKLSIKICIKIGR